MTYVIGVAGSSGSGKTTVSQKLENYFCEDCVIISMDNYYRTKDDREARQIKSFDDPAAIDFDLLVTHIRALKNGQPIQIPYYDFTVSDRNDSVTEIAPKKIIIVEGIFALCYEELNSLLNVKIFVETDIDICKERRIKRDMIDRRRSKESVEKQWNEEVEPSYRNFIEPSQENADLIFENSGNQEEQQTLLHDLFTQLINKKNCLTSQNRYCFNKKNPAQDLSSPSLYHPVEGSSLRV